MTIPTDDLFNIESEEELEKLQEGIKITENDLSNVMNELEIPTYNEDDISQRKGNYILSIRVAKKWKNHN